MLLSNEDEAQSVLEALKSGDCPKANERAEEATLRIKNNQVRYDHDTDHGHKTGANF